MSFVQLEARDLPDDLVESISALVGSRSTVLVRLTVINGTRMHEPVGTGTFVKIGEVYGIVTAGHVADQFQKSDSLGVTLIKEAQTNEIPWQFLRRIDAGSWLDNEHGPDLCFLVLPANIVSEIKHYKYFSSLTVLGESRSLDEGERQDPFFLYGLIGERTTIEGPESGFEDVQEYQILSTLTYVESFIEKGGFDYLDVLVDSVRGGRPRSYQGTSGGGLWRVTLKLDEQGRPSPKDYIYTGVAFRESPEVLGQRKIRCHGPGSLDRLASRVNSVMRT